MKKGKAEFKERSQDLLHRKEKKSKNKKNKKGQTNEQKKNQELIVQENKKQKDQIDYVALQLAELKFDGNLTPNYKICDQLNEKLRQLTINLIQKVIMKQSTIVNALRFAKINKLSPRQYFIINYTNKLCYICKLFDNCPRKYGRFKNQAEQQINRVENLIIRSMQDVRIVDEVFNDLSKNNIEWQINQQFLM